MVWQLRVAASLLARLFATTKKRASKLAARRRGAPLLRGLIVPRTVQPIHMTTRATLSSLFACILLLGASAVRGGPGDFGEAAPDFPPGVFNDGQRYSLSDFEGKVVVLFFYEKDCPSCRKKIPERNAIVQQYQGKPVRFFAVAAG